MRHRASTPVPTVLAICAFLLFAGCSEDTPETAQDVEVSGYVKDEVTKRAIRRAAVTFTSDVLDTASTTADDDGYYEMAVTTNTPTGRIAVSASGYLPGEASVFFDVPSRRVDLELRPESAPPEERE